ncbi:hypothetical protein KFS98_003687 [Salmonella enterica]|nr:hypothetical protein [Salmonella enterica]
MATSITPVFFGAMPITGIVGIPRNPLTLSKASFSRSKNISNFNLAIAAKLGTPIIFGIPLATVDAIGGSSNTKVWSSNKLNRDIDSVKLDAAVSMPTGTFLSTSVMTTVESLVGKNSANLHPWKVLDKDLPDAVTFNQVKTPVSVIFNAIKFPVADLFQAHHTNPIIFDLAGFRTGPSLLETSTTLKTKKAISTLDTKTADFSDTSAINYARIFPQIELTTARIKVDADNINGSEVGILDDISIKSTAFTASIQPPAVIFQLAKAAMLDSDEKGSVIRMPKGVIISATDGGILTMQTRVATLISLDAFYTQPLGSQATIFRYEAPELSEQFWV